MKRINNKGFTLVELLAILVILITILTIAIPSITSSVERNKQNVLNKKIDIIEVAAETFVNQYKNKFGSYSSFTEGTCCVDINKIKEKGILTEEDLKDANGDPITGYICLEDPDYIYHESGKTECTIN